jgi:hypothetical protein
VDRKNLPETLTFFQEYELHLPSLGMSQGQQMIGVSSQTGPCVNSSQAAADLNFQYEK